MSLQLDHLNPLLWGFWIHEQLKWLTIFQTNVLDVCHSIVILQKEQVEKGCVFFFFFPCPVVCFPISNEIIDLFLQLKGKELVIKARRGEKALTSNIKIKFQSQNMCFNILAVEISFQAYRKWKRKRRSDLSRFIPKRCPFAQWKKYLNVTVQ